MRNRLIQLVAVGVVSAFAALPAQAREARNPGRAVDDGDTVVLVGNVHALARPEFEVGATDLSGPMEKMVLALKIRPEAQARLEQFLAEVHDPTSASYHRWLTPEEFGARFGPSREDVDTVVSWLESHGFVIEEVGKGRLWINFSGTVGDVERAFRTEIRDYLVDDHVRHANAWDPSIPRALADIVKGVVSLHNFPRRAFNRGFKPISPDEVAPHYTGSTGSHYLAPADFAKIYNVNPLYTAGINGSGQTIAIVGRTDINLADVQYFRSYFGLPANDPVFVHNGTDPGNLGGGEEGEADLDVEWSGAVAPNATVKFVISKSTTTTDGVDLSAQYIVNNNLAPVMSTSFGQCESTMGTTEMTFYNNLWSQAATQGISSFVSSGDSGASGCDGGSATTGAGLAVSGLCSTPYNICVGGAQFMDTASPSTYWSGTNDATTKASVLSYIPEQAWNESANVTGGSGLWATGGGVSGTYVKPSWQVAPGVPADGKRDVPDVALTAAGHDGYLTVQGHTATASGLAATGGTSASSPSFAGLMALIVQKTAARQGNANTRFYQLGNAQYGSAGAVVFHDVTTGNNSVPGVTGYSCTTGYDLATGLGTVDANALANNWAGSTPAPDFTLSASPTSVSAAQGGSTTATVSTTVSGGFNAAVSLSASGLPAGATATFNPVSIAAPGSGSSTLTLAAGASTTAGTYTVTITGSGGGKTHTATVSFTVTASGGGSTSELIADGGFESATASGLSAPGWSATTNITGHNVIIAGGTYPHTGTDYAFLGANNSGVDTLTQTVSIPSNATAASLTFWANVVTQESANTGPYDFLYVEVHNSAGTLLATPLTLNNNSSSSSNNTNGTYFQPAAISLVSYKGQTIQIVFHSTCDGSLPTSFRIDDVSLKVTTSGTADTTPPTTSVTAPANGATVSGTVAVSATASDNVGVTKMELYIDGALASSNTNVASLSYSWNTTAVANASHTIVSKAYDAAGNVGTSATVTVTVSNTVTTQQLLGNPGFENGSTNVAPWVAGSGVIDNSAAEPAHSGSWKAWLCGYGTTHTDTVYQQVTIPASATSATLTFWLHIDTAETTTVTAYDTLQVQIRNSAGTALATLATYSNLNAAAGYVQKSFNLASYKGQTIQVYLVGSEDSSAQTSFVLDDFALNVQ